MPALSIDPKDLLDALIGHLEHLAECRDFVEKFRRGKHDEYALNVAAKKEAESGYKWESERLVKAFKEYDDCYKEQAQRAELAVSGERCSVDVLLEDVAMLRAAKRVVEAVAAVVGHYDRNLPRDLTSSMDALTRFDDSE